MIYVLCLIIETKLTFTYSVSDILYIDMKMFEYDSVYIYLEVFEF